MFPNCQKSGQCLAFPDVCKTPAPPAPAPIPIPYPNIGVNSMTVGFSTKVMIDNMPGHNMGSKVAMTSGDEPGFAMGLVSNKIKAPVRFVTGAFTVLIQGKPATRMTSVSIQNGTNAPGMQLVPSQVKVLVLAP